MQKRKCTTVIEGSSFTFIRKAGISSYDIGTLAVPNRALNGTGETGQESYWTGHKRDGSRDDPSQSRAQVPDSVIV